MADTSLPDAVPALMFYLNKQRSKVKVVWLDGQLSRCCISGHLAVYRFVLASWRPVPLSLLHLTTATIMMTTISRRTCFISGTVKSLCSIPTISLLPVVLSLPAFFPLSITHIHASTHALCAAVCLVVLALLRSGLLCSYGRNFLAHSVPGRMFAALGGTPSTRPQQCLLQSLLTRYFSLHTCGWIATTPSSYVRSDWPVSGYCNSS